MNIEPMKPPILERTDEVSFQPTGPASVDAAEPRPNRHATRAAEYRVIAAQALSSAETSGLAHVREKFARSAQVWTEMAEADERRAQPLPAAR
jgi:hypothetical protein